MDLSLSTVRLGGSNKFAPKKISSCEIWLDATVGVTSSGGNVSQWNDRSGNVNNVSQGTGSKQPNLLTDDGTYIQSNGTSDLLSRTSLANSITLPATYAAVLRVDDVNDGGTMTFFDANSGGRHIVYAQATTPQKWQLYSGSAPSPNVAITEAVWMVLVVELGTSAKLRVNGVEEWTGTTGTGQTMASINIFANVAGAAYGAISLKEFVAYRKSLSAAETTVLENYLNNRHQVY